MKTKSLLGDHLASCDSAPTERVGQGRGSPSHWSPNACWGPFFISCVFGCAYESQVGFELLRYVTRLASNSKSIILHQLPAGTQ